MALQANFSFTEALLTLILGSSLIQRKTDSSESKKETKLVAPRDKKKKNAAQIVLAGLKQAQNFLNFLKFIKMLEKNLVSFQRSYLKKSYFFRPRW